MGVYIKGMDKGLLDTILKNWDFDYAENNRWELVEIPEPHGRLIDADKLYSVIEQHHDLFKGATNTNDMARRDEDLQVMSDIVNAPTVIEAEGE